MVAAARVRVSLALGGMDWHRLIIFSEPWLGYGVKKM
jgi:hypothetical protein